VDPADEALVEKFRKTRDISSFQTLVRRYQNRIYTAAFRILDNSEEAEEVMQETFVKVHQNLPKYRPQAASFSSWVFKIAHNICLDILRARHRRKGFHMLAFDPQAGEEEVSDLPLNVVGQIADPSLDPSQQLDMSEQGLVVAQSLRALPENQRTVLILHDIEGFSYQEISDIVGANLGTVRSRLHYGRIKLKELLDPYFSQQNVSTASR